MLQLHSTAPGCATPSPWSTVPSGSAAAGALRCPVFPHVTLFPSQRCQPPVGLPPRAVASEPPAFHQLQYGGWQTPVGFLQLPVPSPWCPFSPTFPLHPYTGGKAILRE